MKYLRFLWSLMAISCVLASVSHGRTLVSEEVVEIVASIADEEDFDATWVCLDNAYCSLQLALCVAEASFNIAEIACFLDLSIPCYLQSIADTNLAKATAMAQFQMSVANCYQTYGPTCGTWTPPVS